MTDLPPRSPLPEPLGDEADLLASLYLDGEANPEERALVEADPALLALVEEFRAMAADVSNVSVPAGLAPSQIAAALDAFDAASEATNVTSMADRRAKEPAGLPSWLGAAAVMALVVGGLGFAATRGSGGDDEAATADVAPSASASNEANESAATTMMMDGAGESADLDDGEAFATEVAGDDGDDDAAMEADESMEEGSDDAAAPTDRSTLTAEEAEAFYDDNGPINLAEFEATTATEYYEQLIDRPLRPIDASPCADSPLVAGLFGVDSFIPVVFDGELASLIFQDGAPNTALIVGPSCEIEQS